MAVGSNPAQAIISSHTSFCICFAWHKEWSICWVWLSKFSDALSAFSYASASNNPWRADLSVTIVILVPWVGFISDILPSVLFRNSSGTKVSFNKITFAKPCFLFE